MVRVSSLIPDLAVRAVFLTNTSGGNVGGMPIPGNHYDFGKQFVDTSITFEIDSGNQKSYASAEAPITDQVGNALVAHISNPFDTLTFKRIFADRDIQPEQFGSVTLGGNGSGATTLIHHFLTDSTADEDLVRVSMLEALNRIFAPDSRFHQLYETHQFKR